MRASNPARIPALPATATFPFNYSACRAMRARRSAGDFPLLARAGVRARARVQGDLKIQGGDWGGGARLFPASSILQWVMVDGSHLQFVFAFRTLREWE